MNGFRECEFMLSINTRWSIHTLYNSSKFDFFYYSGVSVVNVWMMELRKLTEVGVHGVGNGWGAQGHVAEEYSGEKEHAQSQSP